MNQSFSYNARVEGGRLVISTNGYVNQAAGEQIAKECYKHIDSGVKIVILDLKNSRIINSIGISILIEIIEKLQSAGGKMIFTNLDGAVDKTLTIMGIFQLTQKASTLDEALKI